MKNKAKKAISAVSSGLLWRQPEVLSVWEISGVFHILPPKTAADCLY